VWVAGTPGYSETTQTDGGWTVHNHPADPWSYQVDILVLSMVLTADKTWDQWQGARVCPRWSEAVWWFLQFLSFWWVG